ncbi:hypothetical protein [uncultured Helicobacter sp.]|uniref:hypothetical protein n=1 Tax=uncultured Helicobacter sp. TaxID=175537 RepID=UPI0026299151|nr:hypothetical protein [uncultured Helicobacter sp.]
MGLALRLGKSLRPRLDNPQNHRQILPPATRLDFVLHSQNPLFQAIQSWVSNAIDCAVFGAVITDLGNSYPKNRAKQPQPHRKS